MSSDTLHKYVIPIVIFLGMLGVIYVFQEVVNKNSAKRFSAEWWKAEEDANNKRLFGDAWKEV